MSVSIITNRRSHTVFLLVPTSVTLNDLERHNSPYFVFFSPNSIVLQADYVTVHYNAVPFFYFWPKLIRTLQRGFSAIAKLLFILYSYF